MLSNKIKLVLAFVLSVYGREALAQISPGYIQQESIKLPGKTTDAQIDALSVTDKQVTRTYIDGMGRTLQQVAVQASPLQNDIIQPVVYDNLGHQTVGYLPYAGKSTDIDGSYRANAITDQAAFYNNGTADKVADDSTPYSQQIFENSPLLRLLTAGMAGSGFQPTVSGNHYKTVKYRYNSATADGNILTWNADGTFTAGTYYADNTLSVTDGIDEDNVETLSYADIAGRTILKRQMLSAGNLDTYYIYNLAGAISYVVPPKATTLLAANSYNLSAAPLSNLVFKYLYDARGRIIEKTVPAKGKMVIVYDPLNRPVLLQDAAMALVNKWNYIKYDSKNRTISQGIYLDNTNIGRANMQTYVSGLAIYNTTWFENRSGTVINSGYYTNSSFPTTGITPLAYAYFDNYDLNQDGTADFTYTAQGLSGEGSATTAPLKGVPTVISQTTVGAGLTNTLLTKVTFYDKRGNAIQVKSNNQVYYTGATTLTDTKTVVPDFTGAPQVSLVIKKSSATAMLAVQTTLSYDHMKRVTAVDQRYNGAAPVRVAAYTYNELGQVIDKNLGSTNVGNTAWLQSVDMRYNIHGQLLSINNSKLSNDGVKNDDSNDLFGMEMLYDQADANVGNTVRYNGNLSAVKWMTKDGSGVSTYERSYKYSYDAVNRYTGASYAERTTAGTGAFNNNIGGFNEAVGSYDAGGNILTLTRNSSTQGTNSNVQIDNLAYSYDTNNPNQLKTVTDATGNTGGFKVYPNTTGSNYTYDVNGNLTADPYKGLTINYNVLNRTDKITVTTSTGRYINYTYDAGGALVRKQAYDNNVLGTTTDYVDGFVYLNGVISYFAMPEGRVRNTGSGTTVTLKQEFIVTDQQGNARISFEDLNNNGIAVVRQETSYYGFGLSLANSPLPPLTDNNKNLYNGGSEWQNDYGNLPDLQQTFYRNYDAALGRWIAVDPVAESAESMTVYQYAGNNPIMLNDPLGDKLPAEGSGITLDWTTNATPYVPHRSLFGSGIDPTILQAGEMYVSGNSYGDYSALWVNIFKAAGYTVDKNGIATNSNADPKLSVDYYVDADGKLIAKSSYDGGPGGAHYYGVTVNGTDHGKAKYVVNDEISLDEVWARRFEANTEKWVADYHRFQQSVSNAWNSDFARGIINDDLGVHLGATLVPTVGAGYSYNFDLITRGPDAGLHMSQTVSIRVGEEAGVSAVFVRGNYHGPVNEITYGSQGGWGGDINVAAGPVSAGGWRSVSIEGGQLKTLWTGTSLGTGFGVGGSGGISYTWIVH